MTLLIGFIVFAAQYYFWKMAFGDNAQMTIKGYTFNEIIQYYLLLRIVSDIVDSRAGFRMGELILSGKISFLLLKPVTLKKWMIAEEVGRVFVDLLTKALFFFGIAQLIVGLPQLSWIAFLLLITSLLLSFLLSFTLFFIVGCVAFYVEAVAGLNYAFRRVIFFFSGGLIPLAFFPETFQRVLNFLPFKYIFDLPVSIFLHFNQLSPLDLVKGLGIQLFWIIVVWKIGDIVFDRSVKHNQSVGI